MKKSIVFPMRYDNMIAITNGLSELDHRHILDSINLRYPVSVSMSVASGRTPYDVEKYATELLNDIEGPVLRIGSLAKIGDTIQIAHMDINNVTEHTNRNAYLSYDKIISVYHELIHELGKKGALVFYMGGDNFIAPCNGLNKKDFQRVFKSIKKKLDISLKAGIGIHTSAEDATRLASIGLKEIRNGLKDNVIVREK